MINVLMVNYDADGLARYGSLLAEHGITACAASTMQKALDMLLEQEYSGVVINADDFEYLPLLKVMRALTASPIGVAASRFSKEENDKVDKYGADIYRVRYDAMEYRVKNFSTLVKGCLEANVRRKHTMSVIACGDVRVRLDTREVFVQGKEIDLKGKEFDILHYLIINKGIVLSYGQVFRHVWGDGYEDNSRQSLRNQISRLRGKLQIYPEQPDYIRTVRGVGYCFTA